jgi:hypothetical protein
MLVILWLYEETRSSVALAVWQKLVDAAEWNDPSEAVKTWPDTISERDSAVKD